MTEAEQFFYTQAPYAWTPKIQTEEQGHLACATLYAEAEARARANGWHLSEGADSSLQLLDSEGDVIGMVGHVAHSSDATTQRLWLGILSAEVPEAAKSS